MPDDCLPKLFFCSGELALVTLLICNCKIYDNLRKGVNNPFILEGTWRTEQNSSYGTIAIGLIAIFIFLAISQISDKKFLFKKTRDNIIFNSSIITSALFLITTLAMSSIYRSQIGEINTTINSLNNSLKETENLIDGEEIIDPAIQKKIDELKNSIEETKKAISGPEAKLNLVGEIQTWFLTSVFAIALIAIVTFIVSKLEITEKIINKLSDCVSCVKGSSNQKPGQ
jgi:predicted PurR-regulated permease PerM